MKQRRGITPLIPPVVNGRTTWSTPTFQQLPAPTLSSLLDPDGCDGFDPGCAPVTKVLGNFSMGPTGGYLACGYLYMEFPASVLYQHDLCAGTQFLIFLGDAESFWPAEQQCCPTGTWDLFVPGTNDVCGWIHLE